MCAGSCRAMRCLSQPLVQLPLTQQHSCTQNNKLSAFHTRQDLHRATINWLTHQPPAQGLRPQDRNNDTHTQPLPSTALPWVATDSRGASNLTACQQGGCATQAHDTKQHRKEAAAASSYMSACSRGVCERVSQCKVRANRHIPSKHPNQLRPHTANSCTFCTHHLVHTPQQCELRRGMALCPAPGSGPRAPAELQCQQLQEQHAAQAASSREKRHVRL